MTEPLRSAAPAAAVGIVCLGLAPLLGGPDEPLHWAVSGGIVGFGVLLALRHRLRGSRQPLAPLTTTRARSAGRVVLGVAAAIALGVGVVLGRRLYAQEPISLLSAAMPALGLLWLVVLGKQMLSVRGVPEPALNPGDRPSRRPPGREPRPSQPPAAASPDRHASL